MPLILRNKFENKCSDEFIILQYNNIQWNIDKDLIKKAPYLQKLTKNPSNNQFYILPANDDCNFNKKGLDIFFEMLGQNTKKDYNPPEELICLLAVSTFFQCQELCHYSEQNIIKSVDETVSKSSEIKPVSLKLLYTDSSSLQNVLEFFIASEKYSMEEARTEIFHWLEINFMSRIFDTDRCESQLEKMDEALMLRLLKDQSFIVPDEYKLYTVLKKWMIVDLTKKNQQQHYDNIDSQECFLDTVVGQQYKPFFDLIRLQNLIDYTDKVELIRRDHIFSNKQINAAAYKTLLTILDVQDKK